MPVELGAAANPPGFDAELTGLEAGASKAFRLRFPDDYTVPELAGTDGEFAAQVKAALDRKEKFVFIDCRLLNVGGGLGIAYTAKDQPASIEDYVETKVREKVKGLLARFPIYQD